MAGLDGLTNGNVSYSSDSRRVPATVLGELMPAGCHMDGAYDSVCNAYALIRRLADAKAPQNPILHMPARSGCPARDETAMTVVANVSQETYVRCESCGLIRAEDTRRLQRAGPSPNNSRR